MKSSKSIVEAYLKNDDWRVKENSNCIRSVGGLNKYITGEVSKDYWLREVYDEEIAQAYVSSHIHLHDLGGLTLYCSGYSLRDLLMKGVRGVDNIPASAPPKHFYSALNQVANIVTIFQNEIMGAVAFNSFDTLLAPFIKNDNLSYDDVKQGMQNFVFAINSNSRGGAEPAFSNLTFDLTPPEDLLDDYVIIGGELASFTYRSCQREMDMMNKAFFEIMLEGDADHKLFAYPIPTYNIHKRFDWDNPNNKLLWELAGKFGTPYFANYINSDMNPEDARSMCPLSPNTKIIYFSDRLKSWKTGNIDLIYKNKGRNENAIIKTIANGKVINCRINKFDIPANYEITLSNNAKIVTTANHLNKVYGRDYVKTKDLTTGDYLPYYAHPITINDNMSYEDGKLVGMFIGDGSYKDENRICYSLNRNSKSHLIDFIYDYCPKHFNATIREEDLVSEISGKSSCVNVIIKSLYLKGLIQQFVEGKFALNKCLSANILNTSEDFRRGIIDGLYDTDGGNNNRIYSSSESMVESLELLFASLGMATNITFDERDGRLGENKCYTIRYYTPENRNKYSDIYIKDNDYIWFRVKNIAILNNKSTTSYCLEVLDEDVPEEFMLANGIITHNCRLRLDLTELRKRNGGLFGSGDSTGSIGVVTLNLPRIAYESSGDSHQFYKKLDYYLDIAKRSLMIKREWLEKNILETDFIPAFNEYVGSLKNYFSTIGVVGMNEMCMNFFEDHADITTEKGKAFAEEVGQYIREKLIQYQEETKVLYNYEATPAESTCYRLALNDKKDYEDIITQGSGKDCYYTNSCHIPVKSIKGIDSTFKHQETLQCQFTGGTVIHCMLEGAISGENAKEIVKSMFTKYKEPYMSLSPISRYCPEHGYVKDIVDKCPICKSKLKKYQRITGYLRCIDNFNRGKRAEFNDRKQLNVSEFEL